MKVPLHKSLALIAFWGFIVFSVQGQSVMQKLNSNQETTAFAQALEKSKLSEKLNNEGPFTLFAPSNRAFNQLSNYKKNNNDLLLNHIFMGMATERSLKVMSQVTCLSGRTFTIENGRENDLNVSSIRVIEANIRAQNGVIHIIDGVIE